MGRFLHVLEMSVVSVMFIQNMYRVSKVEYLPRQKCLSRHGNGHRSVHVWAETGGSSQRVFPQMLRETTSTITMQMLVEWAEGVSAFIFDQLIYTRDSV